VVENVCGTGSHAQKNNYCINRILVPINNSITSDFGFRSGLLLKVITLAIIFLNILIEHIGNAENKLEPEKKEGAGFPVPSSHHLKM
jgi:hypothetical protein